MQTLKTTKKITLATLKSFAKRNKENLFVLQKSSFDGMTDCVQKNSDAKWIKSYLITDIRINSNDYWYKESGIYGVDIVGSSRDYFKLYEDNIYFGIHISNCCGSSILAVKK